MGWVLIRGWALINFFCLQDGRLFEVGANSRLGVYSTKYGSQNFRKFRFGGKWKTFRRFVHWKIPGKRGNSKKVDPFFLLERFERNFVFHLRSFTRCSYFVPVQLLPTRQPSWCNLVTGSAANRGLRSNGTTFYLSENPFFSSPKFNIPDFLSKCKASKVL